MGRVSKGLGGAAIAMLLTASAASAQIDVTCASDTLDHASWRVRALLRCHVGVAAGRAPDRCLAKVAARADAHAVACLGTQDLAALATRSDQLVDAVLGIVGTDASRCATTKHRAAIGAVRDVLHCRSRAVRGMPGTTACFGAAERRLDIRWARGESKGPCGSAGGELTLDRLLEAFVADLVTILGPDGEPASLFGTYDAVIGPDPRPVVGASEALGRIAEVSAGTLGLVLRFGPYDSLSLRGPNADTGALVLDGSLVLGGDILFTANATATVSIIGTERRVTGVAYVGYDGDRTVTFAMARPAAGIPPSLNGAHVLTFAHSPDGLGSTSHAAFDLAVPADGIGTCAATSDIDGQGATRGTFSSGECWVSPRGRWHFEGRYAAADPTSPAASCGGTGAGFCRMVMDGRLMAAFPGSGHYLLGWPPIIVSSGSWSATR
ncbi:MAG: hypothetical protein IT294_13395 [Deltaproteobacteria bacterium]|nr:hypothetical protein [Deltaproteobacteria bacterium]